MPDSDQAVYKLKSLCDRLGLSQRQLAIQAGMGPTSLSYYFPTKDHYKGKFLPPDSQWAEPVARVLMDKGATEADIATLFGRQTLEDISEFRAEMRQDMAEVKNLIRRLVTAIEGAKE